MYLRPALFNCTNHLCTLPLVEVRNISGDGGMFTCRVGDPGNTNSRTPGCWLFGFSPDYYIGLTSYRANGKVAPLNQTLLAIDELGRGGTKISTSKPYTVLQSSIFRALTDAFVKESDGLNLTLIKPVEPFSVCYAADKILSTLVGPAVPAIDLVLQRNKVFRRIYGSNSMVRIKNKDVDAWCLGFVDGGLNPRTSIVIGGHQFEDNLLQFDLERQRLGFSSSLLLQSTTCANFTSKKPNNQN
ncbi:hypothetical protein Pfo_017529 [Paulownia fortunei]|nr:hypothetical protein Pfo_017529 [Paulownia fortunei]